MIPRSIPVFCYHDVGPRAGITLERFRAHLDAIQDLGFTTLTGLELYAVLTGKTRPQGRRMVLTFDDCHFSSYSVVAPELEARGMRGVFFAVTDFLHPGPLRQPEDMPRPKMAPDYFRDALTNQDYEQFINESEAKALLEAGHEVWGHSARHQGCFRALDPRGPLGSKKAHWSASAIYPPSAVPDPVNGPMTFEVSSAYVYNGYWPEERDGRFVFRRRTDQERREFCRDDFSRCLERIKSLNQSTVQLFCWPWGPYDDLAEEELKRAGFHGAFTLERGANAPGSNPLRINRVGVGKNKNAAWVRSRLRMYMTAPGAAVFFKKLRKRPEVRAVLLATDSGKISGGGRQLLNNAAALLELGVEVHGLFAPKSPLADELHGLGGTPHTSHAFRKPLALGRQIRQMVRELGIDVVHTFHNKAYKGGVAAKIFNMIRGGAGCKLFINRGVIFKPNLLFGLWARLADGMVVNSRACAATLTKLGAPKSKINLVFNSLAMDLPPERAERAKRGTRIIAVLNEAPAKGFDVFLEACAVLAKGGRDRDVEYVVCGVAKPEPFLHGLDPRVRDRMRLTGLLDHDQVLAELLAADVLVIPSRQESLPNVLLEGFAAGLACVVTQAGGMPEVVHNGVNGLVCPVQDPAALAEAMHALHQDPALRLRLGRAGYRLVSRRLDNRTKGLELLRVYHGHRVNQPLNLERLCAEPEP